MGKSLSSHHAVFQSLQRRQRTPVYLSLSVAYKRFSKNDKGVQVTENVSEYFSCVWSAQECPLFRSLGHGSESPSMASAFRARKTALEKSLGTCQFASKEPSVSSLSSHDWECTHIIEGSLVAQGLSLAILEGFCASEHLDQKECQTESRRYDSNSWPQICNQVWQWKKSTWDRIYSI